MINSKNLVLLLMGLGATGVNIAMEEQAPSSRFQTLPAEANRLIIQKILENAASFEGALKDLMATFQQPGFEFVDQRDVNKIINQLSARWGKRESEVAEYFRYHSRFPKNYLAENQNLARIANLFSSSISIKDQIFKALIDGNSQELKELVDAGNLRLLNGVLNELYNGMTAYEGYKYENVIPTLLAAGINPTYKTNETSLLTLALHLYDLVEGQRRSPAERMKIVRLIQMRKDIENLIANGADVNAEAKRGTPLEHAQRTRNPELVQIVTDAGAK